MYKAASPFTQKVVAVKRLEPNPFLETLMARDEIRRLFEAEAKAMALLRHPHLVSVWDFDQDEDAPFYVMEYYCHNLGAMMGESFQTERPSRKLRIDAACRYNPSGAFRAGPASPPRGGASGHQALQHPADGPGHGENHGPGPFRLHGETWRPSSGLKVGSPYYTAPEQEANPDAADFSADVFSTGVMLYRMITGRPAGKPGMGENYQPKSGPGPVLGVFFQTGPFPQSQGPVPGCPVHGGRPDGPGFRLAGPDGKSPAPCPIPRPRTRMMRPPKRCVFGIRLKKSRPKRPEKPWASPGSCSRKPMWPTILNPAPRPLFWTGPPGFCGSGPAPPIP